MSNTVSKLTGLFTAYSSQIFVLCFKYDCMFCFSLTIQSRQVLLLTCALTQHIEKARPIIQYLFVNQRFPCVCGMFTNGDAY